MPKRKSMHARSKSQNTGLTAVDLQKRCESRCIGVHARHLTQTYRRTLNIEKGWLGGASWVYRAEVKGRRINPPLVTSCPSAMDM